MTTPFTQEFLHPGLGKRLVCDQLRFEEIYYPTGFRHPMHMHEQEVYLDLCLNGVIQEFLGSDSFIRTPATLYYMPIGAPHSNLFHEAGSTFQIAIKTSWLERVQQVVPLIETLTHYQNSLPTWTAARMYREFQRADNVTPLILEGILLELFGELARHSTQLPENDCPRWLREAKDFLHAHFTDPIAMEAIALAVGVHPSHLMRGFRQQYRCTIGNYIRRLRVEYACHLLSTSNTSPAQVAFAVGFADQSHLNRNFKGLTGMTPSEYQKILGHATQRQEMILSSKT